MWNITSAQSFILWFLHQCTEVICPKLLLGQTGGRKQSGKNAFSRFRTSEKEKKMVV